MKKLLLVAVLFLVSCTTQSVTQEAATTVTPPVNVQPAQPVIQPEPSAKPTATVDNILAVAQGSKCASYNWKDRGVLPKAYLKGMSLVFAKALCRPNDPDVKLVSSAQTGNDVKDALSWYNSNFKALGMNNDKDGVDTLRHAYTLLIGLGARESSGRHCCGRDMSADFNTADSAEAGLFQGSWGARKTSPLLAPMLQKYKNSSSGCFLSVFSDKVKCSANDAKNWGEGEGVVYQETAKKCPAFAAEYTAVLLRVHGGTKGEFGPLRRKTAELNPDCDSMLKQVQTLIEQNPDLCSKL